MKKHLLFVSIAILMGIILLGCAEQKKDDVDIEKYLSDNGFKNCVAEKEAIKVEDQGITYWNIYDEENDIHFWVIKRLIPNLNRPDKEVYDNYDLRLTEKHIDELPEHDGIEFQNTEDPYIYSSCPVFLLKFSDMDDLNNKYDKLLDCAEYLAGLKEDIEIQVNSDYDSPRMQLYKEKKVESNCERGNIDYLGAKTYSKLKGGGMLNEIREKCIDFAYEYRFPEIENEMTQEEIDTFWAESVADCVAVYRSGDPDDDNNTDFYVYEDIYYDHCINIGNLYYLLIAEGFDVEGEVDNYTVHSADGRVCQFSYDYADLDKACNSYYVIDGEQIAFDASFFALRKSTVKELFDLSIEGYSEE